MGTKERRQREAEQRRGEILEAARALFWSRGYEKTTMTDIAQAAELAPGTLYLYFARKSALYTELLMEGYELLSKRLEEAIRREGTGPARARGLVDAFMGFAQESPEYFGIIFFVMQDWEGLPGDQIVRLMAKEQECRQLVATIVRESAYVPIEREMAVVNAVWSMLVGVVFFFAKSGDFEAVAGEAKEMLVRAVFGGEG